MADKIVPQKGFAFGWLPMAVKPTITKDGFYTLRGWQADAFEHLRSVPHMKINAPMGSGKSFLMTVISGDKMLKAPGLRTIIAVPQTIIGGGFVDSKIQFPDKSRLRWTTAFNLCDENDNQATVTRTIKFLEGPHAYIGDRVLVCTHATLVHVFKRLEAMKRLDLIRNLILWVDEAHHLMNAELDGFPGAPVSNGIGKVVAHCLSHPEKNLQVGLATATYCRGDQYSLLTDEMEVKFKTFSLPYDEYMKSMKNLKSFSFDFLLCGKDYSKAIETLLKTRRGKDIIYIPHVNSKHSLGDKYREANMIVEKYKKVYGGTPAISGDGVTVFKKKGEAGLRLIDLVNEDKRPQKKQYITNIQSRDDLDAIIALGMFKEGANWIWADRSIIVGPRNSLPEVIQMVGRLFRDAEGKEAVEVVQLLPFSLDQGDDAQVRENLNNYLKAIYLSLILENVLHPIKIKVPKEKGVKGSKGGVKAYNYLDDALPDDAQQVSLIEDVSNRLMQIRDENEEAGEVTFLWDEYQKSLPSILADYGITENIEEIGRQVWSMFARHTLRMRGIDVEGISFDILQKTDPLEFILRYTSGACGIDTFSMLRTAIDNKYRTLDEWVAIAEKLAADRNGILPGSGWLQRNGYNSLNGAMYRHPETFAHIQQENKFKTIEYYVALAERLASENNGVLPNTTVLMRTKHTSLVSWMSKRPELFSHINRPKHYHTVEEHVMTAERVAAENNNLLPCNYTLLRMGLTSLASCISKLPERFSHLEREFKGAKPINFFVQQATELAAKNNGVIPANGWLQDNKYNGLYNALKKHPEAFNLTTQTRPHKSLEKHLQDAEQLVKDNNGLLPNTKWLRDNGHSGLTQCMAAHPEKFKHIKKLWKGNTPVQDLVAKAEALAAQFGGMLPGAKWLINNGHVSLYNHIRKNLELYEHIKRK